MVNESGALHLPNAEVTFDRYHVKQKLSEAIDEVRRAESKQHKQLLKNTRYLWLKRPANLSAKQQDWRANTNATRRIDVEGRTELMRCCIGDGGAGQLGWWSSAAALQGEVANHRKLRRSRAVRGERLRKRRAVSSSGAGQEGERKRSIDDVSKAVRRLQNRAGQLARDEPGGCLLIGQVRSGMKVARAWFGLRCGTCEPVVPRPRAACGAVVAGGPLVEGRAPSG